MSDSRNARKTLWMYLYCKDLALYVKMCTHAKVLRVWCDCSVMRKRASFYQFMINAKHFNCKKVLEYTYVCLFIL